MNQTERISLPTPGCACSVLVVGHPTESLIAIDHAARAVWQDVTVTELPHVDDAEAQANGARSTLLVLGPGVDAAAEKKAAASVTADGLPRWAVIVSSPRTQMEVIWRLPPGAMDDAAGLAEFLRMVASRHAWLRDLVRARGDLRTISRRVGHEMRSPLGCIMTSADVLREEMAGNVQATRELLQPIIESTAELMELVEQFTLIARSSASPVEATAVDMGAVVWAARERLADRVIEGDAGISEPDSWPMVQGVGSWLERIWQSLINNAFEHAGPNPRIQLGWRPEGGMIRFFVRDEGLGVPGELRPYLFRPFHLLHRADSGRGLGLALVQRLTDLQGGRCGYEPVEPHGSCFFFTLPAAQTDLP